MSPRMAIRILGQLSLIQCLCGEAMGQEGPHVWNIPHPVFPKQLY